MNILKGCLYGAALFYYYLYSKNILLMLVPNALRAENDGTNSTLLRSASLSLTLRRPDFTLRLIVLKGFIHMTRKFAGRRNDLFTLRL